MNNSVQSGQNFIDKVLEITGSDENAFAMALANNRSVTDDVIVGQEFTKVAVTRKGIVRLYKENNRPISGSLQTVDTVEDTLGIGTMTIGTNFIID